jgi:protein phosphatase PTC7
VTDNLLAVADGVGGWAESGIDPANFSKRLCVLIEEGITSDKKELYLNQPRSLLVDAVR